MRGECNHTPTGVMWLVSSDHYSMQSAKCANCNQWLIRETTPIGYKFNWYDWRLTV